MTPSLHGSFFIPPALLFGRDLSGSVGAAGGATVQADVLGTLSALRPHSRTLQLGASLISGLKGNVSLPAVTTGPVLQWVAEGASAPNSEPVFGGSFLSPKRASGFLVASKQLLVQSAQAERVLVEDLRAAAGAILDHGALVGTGTTVQPLGIFIDPAITTTVTFAGAATVAKVVEFEGKLGAANADVSLALLTTAAVRQKWRTLPAGDPGACPLWDSDNLVCGLPAMTSEHVPSNRVVVGNWADLVICVWATEIISDPFFNALSGHTRFAVNLLADTLVRRPKSFVVSTDAGNQ